MSKRTNHLRKLALVSALLSVGISSHALADPNYQVQRVGPLCPIAQDPSQYNTKYLSFFTALVQGEGDWLFRTRYDLRTDFGTTAAG